MTEPYRVLFIGDFHFGENYAKRSSHPLHSGDYEYPLKHLRRFVEAADFTVANLETPLVSPDDYVSPFRENKEYVHWSDPTNAGNALAKLRIDAVSLANNHTLDYGEEGILSTLKTLDAYNIQYFGAGRDILEAQKPLTLTLPRRFGGGLLNVYGMFDYRTKYATEYGAYAAEGRAGCNPLRSRFPENLVVPRRARSDFNIAFPHWGANYRWPMKRQLQQAHTLAATGVQLVIGHGSHCLQGLRIIEGVPILDGIGNGMFLSRGRFSKYVKEYGILPYGSWTMLEIDTVSGYRRYSIKMYPVCANNVEVGYQPGPVGVPAFERATKALFKKMDRTTRDLLPIETGRDALGQYIQITLPARSQPPAVQ